MTGAGIRLEHVEFARSDYRCLFNINVPANALVAVTGPSGAGKTTLLDLIAGFEMANSGHIFVGKQEVTEMPPAERPVSALFQDNNLLGHLNAFDNVALGLSHRLRLSAEERDAANAAMARVGLDGMGKRLPRELSGGERQRVALGRALVRNRPVLLLDEPFAALGPALRRQMAALVDEIRQERDLTVLLVTHDPVDVADIASHVAFVHAGTVLAFGRPDEVLNPDSSAEIRGYLGGGDA